MPRTTILAGVVMMCACGGAVPPPRATAGAHPAGTNADAPGPSHAQRAVDAYLAGDLDRASAQAQAAMQLDPDDAHAMEVAARVSLAKRDAAEALAVLERAHGPVLLRLRARAQVLAGNVPAALRDLEAVDGQEPPDGWSVAMLPILRSATEPHIYGLGGAAEATLPYAGASAEEVSLPVVHVTIDGHAMDALVSTAAGLTVLGNADTHAHGTILHRVELGGIVIENVPALSRSLADVAQVVHREIGAVIGTELLIRLHATLDGRGRRLILRTQPAPPSTTVEVATADYAAFEGAMLAVRANIGDGPVGYWEVDTSLDLPLALTERAVTGAHIDLAHLPPAPGAPPGVKMVQGVTLHLGTAQIDGVPGIVGIVPDELAHIAGTRIDGILGQQIFGQLTMTIDTEARQLLLQ